eukprot:TRINITY_DN2397_c0_g1_i7.p1 TRINITY_DN2397_c0_g1~~TRINITY_DN2397_c0_g1_i7.p1  ORF type:complete len:215 (+),score=18.22 TRINITY_DN2397_c0_g1_i7:1168-1812(+)
MDVISLEGVAVAKSSADSAIRTVQSEVLKSYQPYLPDGVQMVENKTIGQLGLPVVYCKPGSAPDIACVAKVSGVPFVLSVLGVQRLYLSPLEGLQQVGLHACAAAAGLYKAGVDPDKILVPMSVCTGIGEMHGAAYMATPTLPVPITTSAHLDLLSDGGLPLRIYTARWPRSRWSEHYSCFATRVGQGATSRRSRRAPRRTPTLTSRRGFAFLL